MSFGGRSRHAAVFAAWVACGLMLAAGAAEATDDSAHEMADKFSSDGAGNLSPEERRKADEERKHAAERQAQEALREAARKRAEAALKADREKLKAASKPAPKLVKPVADPQTEEYEMLRRAQVEEEARRSEERARAEDEARRRIEAILAEPEGPTPEEVAAQNAELRAREIASARRAWQASHARIADAARREAEARALAEAVEIRAQQIAQARRTWAASHARIAEDAKREAEAKALADAEEARAREIAQARRTWAAAQGRLAEAARREAEAKTAAREIAESTAPPQTVASLPAPMPLERPMGAGIPLSSEDGRPLVNRVTILIVMMPGNKGIRRHNKTADPVLCVNDGCYLSEGPEFPARFLPTRRALGLGGVFGERAAACQNRLGCVFRGVAVGEVPLIVQPIDMRVVKHDRRRIQAIESDSQCRAEGQRLVCSRGIYAEDYAMWVVPETLARSIGPAALERALLDGLNGPRSAGLAPGRF